MVGVVVVVVVVVGVAVAVGVVVAVVVGVVVAVRVVVGVVVVVGVMLGVMLGVTAGHFFFSCPGLKLASLTNTREHWSTKHRRAKAQREAGRMNVLAWKNRLRHSNSGSNFRITIRRYGPRTLDSDNLASSAKHLRDGIADALGIDDGSSRLEWRYEQEKAKGYSVMVTIEVGA